MKTTLSVLKIAALAYIVVCVVLYFIQERLIFFPEKIAPAYRFQFDGPFEEMHFTTTDRIVLHGLLFKSEHSKGLIFYLHGNAGSLRSWGAIAKTYTDLHYDLFMLDYRGYGKSEGTISNETQFYNDVQQVYDSLQTKYSEKETVVLGYSIGTGAATKLASVNHPKLLILQAPYYSLTDLMRHTFPLLPAFMLKYHFPTHTFLKNCTMPVVIFHGDKDEVIYYGSSLTLKALFKPADTLVALHAQGHNGMSDNPAYCAALRSILGG
jgi:pimeloyl-ACP methyl ester carboxylesterase